MGEAQIGSVEAKIGSCPVNILNVARNQYPIRSPAAQTFFL
jgi:hypothetical protein